MSYSIYSEAYTRKGWVSYDNLREGDEILTCDKEKVISFQEIKNIDRVWKNTMEYIHNLRGLEICISKDHNCLIYQTSKTDFKTVPEFNKSTRFIRRGINNQISPKTVDVSGIEMDIEDYIMLTAFYLAEGCTIKTNKSDIPTSYRTVICQTEKGELELIHDLVTNISEKYGISKYLGNIQCHFYDKNLYDYYSKFGKTEHKYIPGILFKLSQKDIETFLNYYIMGDGTIENRIGCTKKEIYTSSPRLISGISGLIVLAGYYPSDLINKKKGTPYKFETHSGTINLDNHRLELCKNYYNEYRYVTHDVIDYNNYAIEVDVPNAAIWTRHKNKVCFI